MTHQSSKKLVKYLHVLLIEIIVITIAPESLSNGKCNGVGASETIIGMKETLQTFKISGCLTAPLEVKCPEATVIDIISARYGALALNSTEEKNCLHQTDYLSSSVTAASVASTTRAQRTSPYYALSNDYLDDFTAETRATSPSNRLPRHRRRHSGNRARHKKRSSDLEDDYYNCQGHVDIKDLLVSICRSRQRCPFSLDSDELSSIKICNSSHSDIYSDLRFMEVEFRCGPRTRSQSWLCEGDTFTAECAEGQRLVIFDGYFGALEKERSPLLSAGSLGPPSCEQFAKRQNDKWREVMMMRKYSMDSGGSLVDSLGHPVDPWLQLTTCRTTAMKAFLMNQCHGRRSCSFEVTKQTLWHADLLSNCKNASSANSKRQANHLKVEYTCADRTIFSTVPATLATPSNEVDSGRLSTVSIIIGDSTAPAQDYPYVSLTPKPTTALWHPRARTTTSKPSAASVARRNDSTADSGTHEPDDETDDELSGYSNSPTVPTVSIDANGEEAVASKSPGDIVSAITIMTEASGDSDKSTLPAASGQGAMRTSSSLPSFTEMSGNTLPSDTGPANCTIPPSETMRDADTSSPPFLIIPINNLLSAYSFVARNLEKFVLYLLIAFLASLLAVLTVLSCRLYFSKRYILRENTLKSLSSPPIDILMDDEDDEMHHQLTPSSGTHFSSHTHHRFSSPTTVDGNTTVASHTSLRSDSGHSASRSLSTRLATGAPVNLTRSSPNLSARPSNATCTSRTSKFVSPLARVYFEKHCQQCPSALSSRRSGHNDSGTSSRQGEEIEDHHSNDSPLSPDNGESPNVLVGSYRPQTRDVHSSGDSGNSIAADHESSSSDNRATLECRLHFADDENYLDDSAASDLPVTRASQADAVRLAPVTQPCHSHLRTFSRHPQGTGTAYTSPFAVHRLSTHATLPAQSSAEIKSPITAQSCTSESTPLLTHQDAHTQAAAPSPDASLPLRHSVLHSYSFVHHPHHLNHHQHANPDFYPYHQTQM